MAKARFAYKDGTVEDKTFKGYGEYTRYLDRNITKVSCAECDYVKPKINGELMQEMEEDYDMFELRKQ